MEFKCGDIIELKNKDVYKVEDVITENEGKGIFLRCSDIRGRIEYIKSSKVEKIINLNAKTGRDKYYLIFLNDKGEIVSAREEECFIPYENDEEFLSAIKESVAQWKERLKSRNSLNVADVKVYRSYEIFEEIDLTDK